jgi:uncharacterized protein YjbI with pentapeptide repeats
MSNDYSWRVYLILALPEVIFQSKPFSLKMRTIKKLDHILFRRSLGLNNGLWLSVAVGSFFYLDDPEKTGTSIELWKLAAETLGKDALLDGASPKPVGEFMVCGSCWSATGAPIASSEVEVSVGIVSKRLTVYGDREWLPPGSESPLRCSEPKPFVNMPIDWTHAYGGEGYALNPLGRGIQPRSPFTSWPLPNIESTATHRSSADQTPPASFGMLSAMDPRRNQDRGTYDQNWLENRWPYYPDDFDSGNFNCAEQEQRLKAGFFKSGDPVVIRNMHPDRPELRSRLPLLRHRAFIVQQQGDKEVFLEAPLSIDTVWLWPDRERGLVLARGMFAITDDEAEDVKLLFALTEPLSEPPLSLEACYEKLQQHLLRKVPFDVAPQMPDKDEALKNAAARVESLPDELRKVQTGIGPQAAVPDMEAVNMEQEILQDEAQIAALLDNPEYGTALQVSALRKSIKSRRAMAQALRESALKRQTMDDIELPSVQMQGQLQPLKSSNPQQYEKLTAELDKADEQIKALKAKMAVAEPRLMGKGPIKSRAESLIDTVQALMQVRDAAIGQLKQLQEPLKTDGLSILERYMASNDLARVEGRLKRASLEMQALAVAGNAAPASKDEIRERLLEMSERVAKREQWLAKQPAEMNIAALMDQITREKLAEAQAALKAQTPGVKAPDLLAEYEKALKVQAEVGPDQTPDFLEMLERMPPEAKAHIPSGQLQELKAMVAGAADKMADAEKHASEMQAKIPGGKLDLGKYHPSQKVMTRETVQQTVAEGGSLAGCDFTDLDLSGLDFSGGRFEGSQFVRTCLQGARFNGAKLTGARFNAANASEADFSEADLENTLWVNQSVADKAQFKQARASGMNVQECSFKQSDFYGADLASAAFNKSALDQAGFHKAQMKAVVLIETSATACDFSATQWGSGDINRCDISFSSFEGCCAPHLTIWDCDARSLKANNAVLEHFTVGGDGTRLDDSCFDDATLTRTSQMDISAQRISARRAILDRGYLRKVDMSGSDYYGARARGAQITRCTLKQVNMGAINLMGGSLRKSGFVKTDLSASCLYGTEFYQARFAETCLDGAFTARSGLTAKQRQAAARSYDEEKS